MKKGYNIMVLLLLLLFMSPCVLSQSDEEVSKLEKGVFQAKWELMNEQQRKEAWGGMSTDERQEAWDKLSDIQKEDYVNDDPEVLSDLDDDQKDNLIARYSKEGSNVDSDVVKKYLELKRDAGKLSDSFENEALRDAFDKFFSDVSNMNLLGISNEIKSKFLSSRVDGNPAFDIEANPVIYYRPVDENGGPYLINGDQEIDLSSIPSTAKNVKLTFQDNHDLNSARTDSSGNMVVYGEIIHGFEITDMQGNKEVYRSEDGSTIEFVDMDDGGVGIKTNEGILKTENLQLPEGAYPRNYLEEPPENLLYTKWENGKFVGYDSDGSVICVGGDSLTSPCVPVNNQPNREDEEESSDDDSESGESGDVLDDNQEQSSGPPTEDVSPGDTWTDPESGEKLIWAEKQGEWGWVPESELNNDDNPDKVINVGADGTTVSGTGGMSLGNISANLNANANGSSSVTFAGNKVSGRGKVDVTTDFNGNKLILNNHKGEFALSEQERYLKMQNGEFSFTNPDGVIERVSGDVEAFFDEQGLIDHLSITSAYGSGGLMNPYAWLDIRTHDNNSVLDIDYTDGWLSYIESTTFGESDVELYVGDDFVDESGNVDKGKKENYISGNFELKLSRNSFNSDSSITGHAISDFNPENSISVDYVKLNSEGSIYKFLPRDYIVRSSKYGNFHPKMVCFKDCHEFPSDNLVYVQDDDLGVISTGSLGSIVVDYEGNSREVFEKNMLRLTKSDDDYMSFFKPLQDATIDIDVEGDLLFRLNRESKRDLSVRESLQEHQELYYQNAVPASFADLNEKVKYSDHNNSGYTELNFFSYISNEKRKLVLNRYSYNNAIEMYFSDDFDINIPTKTEVIVGDTNDNDVITYFLDDDLSIDPLVYDSQVYFISPEKAIDEYGEIITS